MFMVLRLGRRRVTVRPLPVSPVVRTNLGPGYRTTAGESRVEPAAFAQRARLCVHTYGRSSSVKLNPFVPLSATPTGGAEP